MIGRLFLALALFFMSASFIKPGQLKQIARCEIDIDPNQVYPGNLVDLTMLTILKDSALIFSNESGATINFADYNIELEGGAVILEKTRSKFILRILDEAYKKPFVIITAKLRRKKSITHTLKLPILYDVIQQISFAGKSGYDPRSATESGFKTIPITKRVNIQFIDNTQTLTNNSDPNIIGGRGMDLLVYISMAEQVENGQYVKIRIEGEQGMEFTKYVRVGVGKLEIETTGGKGGISRTGGKGGKGGDVSVFIQQEARKYFNQILIYNFGGDGGELWRPKVDGQQQGPFGDSGKMEIYNWEY